MRVIAFPGRGPAPELAEAIAGLEAALDGDGTGPLAEEWRELRADVRALTPAIDRGFEERLEGRLNEQARSLAGTPRRSPTRRLRATFAGAGGLAVVALVALVAAGVLGNGSSSQKLPSASTSSGAEGVAAPRHKRSESLGRAEASPRERVKGLETPAPQAPATQGTLEAGDARPEASASGAEAPGQNARRLQQVSASITLGAGSEGVQAIADRVGRIAGQEGGFVQTSRVQLQQGQGGEALMTLKLPSSKLSVALTQLERIAHVRAENQSLEDLTEEFDAVGGRLAAAKAEREALLRALALAQTSSAIESLHGRISQADSKISSGEAQQARIRHTAAQSQLEVTVLGEAQRSSGALTLTRGLHDAGRVLTVSLAVLLIGAAVLVPLALVLLALATAARQWRRRRREGVLGPS